MPCAESSPFAGDNVVEQVHRTSGIAIPRRVKTDGCLNGELRANVTIEARLARGGKPGRKPGQDSRGGLAEKIFGETAVLALVIVGYCELPADARTLIAPDDFHGSDSCAWGRAAEDSRQPFRRNRFC